MAQLVQQQNRLGFSQLINEIFGIFQFFIVLLAVCKLKFSIWMYVYS